VVETPTVVVETPTVVVETRTVVVETPTVVVETPYMASLRSVIRGTETQNLPAGSVRHNEKTEAQIQEEMGYVVGLPFSAETSAPLYFSPSQPEYCSRDFRASASSGKLRVNSTGSSRSLAKDWSN